MLEDIKNFKHINLIYLLFIFIFIKIYTISPLFVYYGGIYILIKIILKRIIFKWILNLISININKLLKNNKYEKVIYIAAVIPLNCITALAPENVVEGFSPEPLTVNQNQPNLPTETKPNPPSGLTLTKPKPFINTNPIPMLNKTIPNIDLLNVNASGCNNMGTDINTKETLNKINLKYNTSFLYKFFFLRK